MSKTGYSAEMDNDYGDAGSTIRYYYSTSYNAATNTSTITITPQIYYNFNWGSDIRMHAYRNGSGTMPNAGVRVDQSTLWAFVGGYSGSQHLNATGGNWNNMTANTGATFSFSRQHNNSGDISFYLGIVGAVEGVTDIQSIYNWPTGRQVSIHEDRTLNVSYNANGGGGAPSATYFYGTTESITLSSSTPTRTGYTFAGWNTESDGTGTSYSAGQNIGTRTSSLTLYAKWTINSYTVTCQDRVGSSSGTLIGTKTASYNYGSSVSGASFGSSTAYDAYYTGYHYTGSSSAVPVTGATTVYRYFALNTWTVAYNANGGSSTPANQTKTYGVALTLAAAIARANTPAGSYTVTYNYNGSGKSDTTDSAARTTSYTFSKWNTAQNGEGTDYSAGGSYTANAAATMYAQWTSTTSTAGVSLPSATWTGRTFDGWYDAQTGGTRVGGAGDSYTPPGNITLYAHWTINTFTYTANAGPNISSVSLNGTSSATSVSDTVDYGSLNTFVAVLDNNVAFDYTFAGWYERATIKVGSDLTYTATAVRELSLTAAASRSAKSYTLSFTKPNTGGSAEVRRTSSPNGGGNIGVLNDGATIYYGDVLVVSYTENPGYEVDVHTIDGVEFTSPATVTVTGAVSVVVSMKNAGVVWIYDGSSWEKYIPMIWNGASWERYIPVIWDGSAWTIY